MNRAFHAVLAATLGAACATTSSPPAHSRPARPAASTAPGVALAPRIAPPIVYAEPIAREDPGSSLPVDWWKKAVFYECHVRSFKDSDGDGHGDFQGLISKLDYLRELGIGGLWLLPVSKSQYHYNGYGVADFRDVERDYGTMVDFALLLKEAHARGIGVIVDLVHHDTGDQHPFFVDAKAHGGHRDWFIWSAQDPRWQHPWLANGKVWYPSGDAFYYALFADFLPSLNFKNASVRAYVEDTLRFWLNKGVDGFRFDGVSGLVVNGPEAQLDQLENHEVYRNFRGVLDTYANRFTVAEAPFTGEKYLGNGTDEFHAVFDFEYSTAVMQALKNEDATKLRLISRTLNTAPEGGYYATLLTNHDPFAGPRPFTQFDGNEAKCKLAATVLLTSSGIPFIYYGEEIGMKVIEADLAPWEDERLRIPMQWDATASAGFTTGKPYLNINSNYPTYNVARELTNPTSILQHYKKLLALRRSRETLMAGTFSEASTSQPGHTFAFVRSRANERIAVILNLGGAPRTVTVDFSGSSLAPARGERSRATAARDLLDGTTIFGDVTPGNVKSYPVTLPAYGARVLPFSL